MYSLKAEIKKDGSYRYKSPDTACFKAAHDQATEYTRKRFGKKAPRLHGPEQAIQVAYAEDKKGRVAVDKQQAKRARAYIDKALDKGLPVMVGVSYADKQYNRDKLTDHFVTIHGRGYDKKGRLYYEFKDPGAGGRKFRAYVDKDTGKLFKEERGRKKYVENAEYQITQIRTYKDVD